ncbi:unnamed protein product [Gongylonema pulchrum]|uniref:Histone H3 n=1 Tax=Gongylonema pulchrum TaxID=637853 RepID=A0A183DXM6_9BILA|nr:unnamed protein product [Gongylonema pulchrum]
MALASSTNPHAPASSGTRVSKDSIKSTSSTGSKEAAATKALSSGPHAHATTPLSSSPSSREHLIDFGPSLHRYPSFTGGGMQMIKFYKDRIFPALAEGKDGGKQQPQQKRATIEIPRYLIEARSPGSKLRVMLAQLEAPQIKKKKRKLVRSPGAPPATRPAKTKKSAAVKDEPRKAAEHPETLPKPQVVFFVCGTGRSTFFYPSNTFPKDTHNLMRFCAIRTEQN